MEALKAIVAAALVVAAVAIVAVLIALLAKAAVVVIAVGAATLVGAILANYIIEAADKNYGKALSGNPNNNDGLAAIVAPWLREAGKQIQESWQHLMNKFPNDYKAIFFEGP